MGEGKKSRGKEQGKAKSKKSGYSFVEGVRVDVEGGGAVTSRGGVGAVSYTHLTLPTKRIV